MTFSAMDGVNLLVNGLNEGMGLLPSRRESGWQEPLAYRQLYELTVARYNQLASRHNEVLRRLDASRREVATLRQMRLPNQTAR